jgi:hypothetical protein
MRFRGQFRMQSFDEAPSLFVRSGQQGSPLAAVERRCCEHGRRYAKRIGREIFKKPQWKRKGGNCPRRCSAQRFFDAVCFVPDGFERFGNDRARTVRSSASDQIYQLTPTYSRIMTIFGRLVQDGQQSIVKAHWLYVSFGRTLPLLYASIYNALRSKNITIP